MPEKAEREWIYEIIICDTKSKALKEIRSKYPSRIGVIAVFEQSTPQVSYHIGFPDTIPLKKRVRWRIATDYHPDTLYQYRQFDTRSRDKESVIRQIQNQFKSTLEVIDKET